MSQDTLFGSWTLISHQFVTSDTLDSRDMFGTDPMGTLVMTPDHRLIALITAKGRQASDSEAALFKSALAYAGPFRIEADQIITTVEVAWNPGWLGHEQARTFALTDGILTIMTPETSHPMFDGRPARGVLKWKRAEG